MIQNIFIKLYKTKFIFKKPKKCKFLIFDIIGSDIIVKYLKKEDYKILSSRHEEINLYCFFASFLSLRFLNSTVYQNYLLKYIELSNPKVVISFIDNNPILWKLKSYFPEVKVVLIQNGIRIFRKKDIAIHQSNIGLNKKFKVDLIFVINKFFAKKYKDYFNCKTKIIGSFINNHLGESIKKTFRKNTICYISQYNDLNKNKKFDLPDKKILKYLNIYAKKKNKKIIIISKKNSKKLIEFCKKNLIYNNWKSSENNNNYNNYRTATNSEVIVTIDSTLGYEIASRGKKVAFFCIRNSKNEEDKKVFNFAWPKKTHFIGSFWSNVHDEKIFDKILNRLFLISEKNYNKDFKKNIFDYMPFDNQNTIFLSEIKKFF